MKGRRAKVVLVGLVAALMVVPALFGPQARAAAAGDPAPLRVEIRAPSGSLRMGDTPRFAGSVTNTGGKPLGGLIVYLSLVSLAPGHEQPLDLEDWSGEKAARIGHLAPGASDVRSWGMRLIAAGRYGVTLTVVDPVEKRPVVSELAVFDVAPKPMLASGRVLAVAVGEPLLLGMLLGALGLRRRGRAPKGSPPTAP